MQFSDLEKCRFFKSCEVFLKLLLGREGALEILKIKQGGGEGK